MEYKEAAEVLAALAICTDKVPVSCDNCPAYDDSRGQKEQRQACNDMLAPDKIAEAIGVVKGYQEARSGQEAAV